MFNSWHTLITCWSSDGREVKDIPYWGRFGTLKTPSFLWRWVLDNRSRFGTGQMSHHYIAEIALNMTLKHNQPIAHKEVVCYSGWLLFTAPIGGGGLVMYQILLTVTNTGGGGGVQVV